MGGTLEVDCTQRGRTRAIEAESDLAGLEGTEPATPKDAPITRGDGAALVEDRRITPRLCALLGTLENLADGLMAAVESLGEPLGGLIEGPAERAVITRGAADDGVFERSGDAGEPGGAGNGAGVLGSEVVNDGGHEDERGAATFGDNPACDESTATVAIKGLAADIPLAGERARIDGCGCVGVRELGGVAEALDKGGEISEQDLAGHGCVGDRGVFGAVAGHTENDPLGRVVAAGFNLAGEGLGALDVTEQSVARGEAELLGEIAQGNHPDGGERRHVDTVAKVGVGFRHGLGGAGREITSKRTVGGRDRACVWTDIPGWCRSFAAPRRHAMRRKIYQGMWLCAALLLTGIVRAQAPQAVPYFNDFEGSVTTGWNSTRLTTTTALTRFMGDFGRSGATQQLTQLRVSVIAGKSYTLLFDAYILRSNDGSHPSHGPDYLNVLIDNVNIFRETFDNQAFIDGGWGSTMEGTYFASADLWGNLGVSTSDAVFRKVAINFVPSGATCTIRFQGGMNEDISNEAWGIDNVRVVESKDAIQYAPKFADVSKARRFQIRATTTAASASGISWADVNNDGYLDGIVTGTAARQFVYSNATKRFSAATIIGGTFYRQATVGDLDNDGDVDFFGMNSDTGEAGALGQGTGSFVSAGALGFTAPSTSENVVAADVNADGWLDLLMFSGNGNHQANNGGATRWAGTVGYGGSGTAASPFVAPFADSTLPAGLNSVGNSGDGVYVASADVNDDGVPDFWYGFGGGRLYVSSPAGYVCSTAISSDVSNTNKVGAAFADYDNDGKVDIFVPTYTAGQRGKLYRGLGNGTFSDVSVASGIADTSGQRSCCWGDYDNDGDLDLYIVSKNGLGNSLYRNNGNSTFTLVDERCRAVGVDCMDACFADYDNDGDLDLAVSVNNATSKLFDNYMDTLSAAKNYLKVRFVGSGAGGTNLQGVGQRVLLLDSTGKVIARRDLGGARGIGTEPVIAHFGGVDPTKKYFVRVFSKGKAYTTPVTPGTASTKIGALTIPQMLTITEAALKPPLRITSWTEDSE